MNIKDLKSLMDAFDPASLLPELGGVLDAVLYAVRIATLLGPVVVLVLGLLFLLFAPKEANYRFGYRCMFGMGSVEAWRFTQRLVGIVWTVLGLGLTVSMVLLTGNFVEMEINDAVWAAGKYVLLQACMVALSCLIVNTVVMTRFTYSGDYRKDRVGR